MLRERKRGLAALVMVALIAASVAACSMFESKHGLTESQIEAMSPEQKVFFYSTQFKYARALAVAYKEQGPCGQTKILACADEEVVKQLQTADLAMEEALRSARVDPPNANFALIYSAYRQLARILEREIVESLLLPQ